jgi:hypothetical protein
MEFRVLTPQSLHSHQSRRGNTKIFVGEASYGTSFHMAVDGCWGPMCDFTGSRLQSDAKPGRCTNSAGYIAYAEINEIIRSGEGEVIYDADSDTDVLLYEGLYPLDLSSPPTFSSTPPCCQFWRETTVLLTTPLVRVLRSRLR